ncbi:uroporphyrinogen-III synthase [Microbulbifer sp. GL-2]|uniref:uroporphyrinogen-III synthase n=1 Tax=Microbulbifer sp. GL-2 TaxID=2591606 RepID=UPI001163D184|nr:uroporphyrinogen-III synthase [Microbulbifer sp. GL-2]BBM01057.1 uroporphyrinogen III methyltransferase [Microbulbifer sp. GL-2]
MSESLRGKRILTTRPVHQSTSWCVLLRAKGAQVDNIPMLAIAPLEAPEAQQAIKNRILDFDQVEEAIFVSQNAVRYGMDWLEGYWPQLPLGPRYYAIGAATANALSARGVQCEHSDAHMNSEDLLNLPSLQQVDDRRILIFRGSGGRTLIGNTLRERGAHVDYCELYQRTLPPDAADHLKKYHATVDAISVHSGETLTNLSLCIEQSSLMRLRQAAIICPSQRVAKQAKDLGFPLVYPALNASDSAMLEAMHRALC